MLQWVSWSQPSTNIERKKVIQLLEKAGGVEKIEKEASMIFNEFSVLSKKEQLSYQIDLSKAPFIASLGNSVKIFPSFIKVQYPSRGREKVFFIFDPDKNPDLSKNLFVQVLDNIFIPNYSLKE